MMGLKTEVLPVLLEGGRQHRHNTYLGIVPR